jgi:hypothetical protein
LLGDVLEVVSKWLLTLAVACVHAIGGMDEPLLLANKQELKKEIEKNKEMEVAADDLMSARVKAWRRKKEERFEQVKRQLEVQQVDWSIA